MPNTLLLFTDSLQCMMCYSVVVNISYTVTFSIMGSIQKSFSAGVIESSQLMPKSYVEKVLDSVYFFYTNMKTWICIILGVMMCSVVLNN